jgi:Tfp pilus assembly protein FimT
MLILAVVVGVSAPRFNRAFRHVQLQRVASDVAALFSYASTRAVAQEEVLRVHFDVEGRRFWLTRASGASPEGPFERVTGRAGRMSSVPAAISWQPSARAVTFYPDGRADPFEMVIADRSQEEYRLVTDVWTGRVKVVERHAPR